MRSLKALSVAAEFYGSLLTPGILSKLPQEFLLIISREVREGSRGLDKLMEVINVEIKARECGMNTFNSGSYAPKAPRKGLPINATLLTGN